MCYLSPSMQYNHLRVFVELLYIYVPLSMPYNYPILTAYNFLHGIMSFSHFRSSLGLIVALPLFTVTDLHHLCSLYGQR
jgi:hypothetical protein